MRRMLQNIVKTALVGVLALAISHCGGGSTSTSSSGGTTNTGTTATGDTSADGSTGSTGAGATDTGSGTGSSSNTDTGSTNTNNTPPSDPYAVGLTAADWDVVSDGEGSVTFDADGILMTPKVATAPGETHGAWLLAKSTETTLLQNFKATIVYTNVAQLRTGTAPNPWEVFWLFFNYTIGSDTKKQTNYVMIKTNGTEMGRAYGEIGQEFLVTNDTPSILIGTEHTITVTKNGTNVKVLLDGALAADFTSAAAPSSKYIYDVPGSIGLYTEDAQVRVSSVKIESL